MKMNTLTKVLFEAAIPEMERKWYDRGIAALEKAKEDGQIIKSAFADAIRDINRATEKVSNDIYYGKLIRPVHARMGEDGNFYDVLTPVERSLNEINNLQHATLNNMSGLLAKLQKVKGDHPAKDELVQFFTSMMPIVTLAKEVKELQVSARDLQAKAREEAGIKAKERTEILHKHENVAKMNTVLREISTKHKAELKASLLQEFKAQAMEIAQIINEVPAKIQAGELVPKWRHVSLKDVIGKGRPRIMQLAAHITKTSQSGPITLPVMESAEKIKAIIEKRAENNAEEIMGLFLNRGSRKLSEILAATSPTKSVELYGVDMRRGLMEATIVVKYENGCEFALKQQIVWVVNQQGTWFYRYPATFHHVMYFENGKLVPMKGADEESMNTQFVASNPA